MKFHRIDDQGTFADIDAYRRYLETNRERLPTGVREFVFCDWFHDRRDSRCPHDAWLESVIIRENASGDRSEQRSVEITARFLGAYHDGFFQITYQDVTSYAFSGENAYADASPCGHGDWLLDEIAVEDIGISHHILFSTSSRWAIRCADMLYRWTPKATA